MTWSVVLIFTSSDQHLKSYDQKHIFKETRIRRKQKEKRAEGEKKREKILEKINQDTF